MVVVTGGAGFIGRAVVRRLRQLGLADEILVVDDLSKGSEAFEDAPDGVKIEQVDLRCSDAAESVMHGASLCFHLAARVGGIGYFHKCPATILDDNLKLVSNIVRAAVKHRAKVVYVSSSMVFEKTGLFPTPEEALECSPPPASAYGFSKLAGEYFCRAFHEQFGLKFVIVRPFNAYGPGEVPAQEAGVAHVIPDLVNKALRGDYPLEVIGDGTQVRSFTYVDDVAEAVCLAGLDPRAEGQDFNIGSSEETSIKELAEKIWRIVGRREPLEIKYVPSYPHDVRRRVPDVAKIERVLGWRARTSIDQGLALTIDWLRERLAGRDGLGDGR